MKLTSLHPLLAMLMIILFSTGCVLLTPVPTATPAPSATFIPTAPTLAITATATVTLTSTVTPTVTPTATLTGTSTVTPTVTPTATSTETPLEAVILTLMVPSSFAENETLQEQVDNFNYQDSAGRIFQLALDLVPNDDYENKLRSARAAENLPDLFVLFDQRQIQEFHEDLVNFADASEALGQLLPGSIKSVSVDGIPYGLPWWRFLCTTSYRHLVASARTDYTEAARQAIITLASGDLQKINYEEANWFPTHVELNKNTANCSPASGEFYTVVPDPNIKSGIQQSENLQAVMGQLDETLRKESPQTGAPLMRADTVFNLDGLTYIVNGEGGEHVNDGRNNSAVLIPITEPQELIGARAEEAMSKALPNGLVLSALVYGNLKLDDDGAFVSFEADPDRTYGLYAQSDEPLTLDALHVYEIQPNGELQERFEDMVGNINGGSENQERFVSVSPIVLFAVGSPGHWAYYGWWICWVGETT